MFLYFIFILKTSLVRIWMFFDSFQANLDLFNHFPVLSKPQPLTGGPRWRLKVFSEI